MSFLFGGKRTGTSTGSQQYPEYIRGPSEQIVAGLGNLMAQPYQAYDGPRIAELTPDQLQAMQMTRDQAGIAGLQMNEAMDMTQYGAGAVTDAQRDQYINPYISGIADNTAREMRRSQDILNNQYGAGAAVSDAFGGARHGILEAEGERNLQRNMMDMYNQQYGDAWRFGQETAERARNRMMAGGQQFGAQAGVGQQMGYQDAGAMMGIGSLQQGQTQRNLDLARSDWQAQQQYPYEQLGYATDTIAALRGGAGTTSSTTTAPKQGYANSLLGLGIGALSNWDTISKWFP